VVPIIKLAVVRSGGRPMRLIVCALISCSLFGSTAFIHSANAQNRRFPYQAVASGDSVYVRSGPGRGYYPTSKLRNGSQVTVHRHDPGGWYMIAPPTGAFSWIRAEYVQRSNGNHGVLTESNVVIRVGSSFGDSRDIEQVRVSKGAEVHILSEKSFPTSTGGTTRMYKISSPRGEYRWVSGRNLVPVGAAARRSNDNDPYSVPSNAKRISLKTARSGSNGPSLFGGNSSRKPFSTEPSAVDQFAVQAAKLSKLDSAFRTMIRGEPNSWEFTGIERGYVELKNSGTHAVISRKLSARFATLDHYKKLKADYDDIIQLTSRTTARESQLASRQQNFSQAGRPGQPVPTPLAENELPPSATSTTNVPNPQIVNRQPAILPAPNAQGRPVKLAPPIPGSPGTAVRLPAPSIQNNRPQPVPLNESAKPKIQFDGAGIIRRVVVRGPGMPQHVLVAPNGRILAYIQAVPGLPLDKYVGQPMGLIGKRTRRQDLKSDLIVVRAMMPVRLIP
jgi:hypothetical protein